MQRHLHQRHIGGYMRLQHEPQSRQVIALPATRKLSIAAAGQIRLTVVTDPAYPGGKVQPGTWRIGL
jgi:hypothetical protein